MFNTHDYQKRLCSRSMVWLCHLVVWFLAPALPLRIRVVVSSAYLYQLLQSIELWSRFHLMTLVLQLAIFRVLLFYILLFGLKKKIFFVFLIQRPWSPSLAKLNYFYLGGDFYCLSLVGLLNRFLKMRGLSKTSLRATDHT